MNNDKLQKLIIAAKKIGATALDEASATDAVDSFPTKTLKEIEEAGLLTASVSSKYGGRNLGLLPETNKALLTILKHIGSGNLVMGRVLEGHINAQILIDEFGSEAQNNVVCANAAMASPRAKAEVRPSVVFKVVVVRCDMVKTPVSGARFGHHGIY